MANQRGAAQGHWVFEFLNRRIGVIVTVIAIGAIALAVLAPSVANDEQVNFDPTGEIYDIRDRAQDVFEPASAVAAATFLVEDPDGIDVLTRDDLLAFKQRSDALRTDTSEVQGQALNSRLVVGADLDLGIEIDGIYSLSRLHI